MTATEIKQKVQLVKGEFTALEASSIIEALIYEKIKFHKTQRFQQWERDNTCDTEHLVERVRELAAERQTAKAFLQQAREAGFNVEINGVLEITLTKPAEQPVTVTLENAEN